jgi:predicted outer membrane repeat protein
VHFTASIADVSHVALRKRDESSSVTVVCLIDIAIQCRNVTNLKIEGITFKLYSNGSNNKMTLRLSGSRGILLINLTFQGSEELTDNIVNSKAVLSRNSNILIVSCLFQRNTGDHGGAIFASGDSNITLTGNVFVDNRATQTGGAIFAQDSLLILNETLGNIFKNNSAAINGGAIHCHGSRLEITSSGFSETFPPSIESMPTLYTCLPECEPGTKGGHYFSNNQALWGGAIHCDNHSSALLNGTVIIFHNNSADVGGAIVSWQSIVTSSTKYLRFTENRARVGGAYYGDHGSLYLGQYDTDTHYFANNSVGAIRCQNGNLTLIGSSKFVRNEGAGQGVAIYAEKITLTLSGEALFAHNRAERAYGGAIYMISSIAVFNGRVLKFLNNSADLGGAIFSAESKVTSGTSLLNFTGNTAQRCLLWLPRVFGTRRTG